MTPPNALKLADANALRWERKPPILSEAFLRKGGPANVVGHLLNHLGSSGGSLKYFASSS